MIVGIGVDLCDVDRIAKAIGGKAGGRFCERVFTEGERAYCDRRKGRARVQSYAARFAAKEAAMKALGTGWGKGVGWHDVEVVRAENEAPEIVLRDGAATVAKRRKIRALHLSLSHTDALAVAWVMAEGASRSSRR